jgi:hypothetical protein
MNLSSVAVSSTRNARFFSISLNRLITKMSGSYKLTFLTKKWRIIDREKHAHRGLINLDAWQRFRIVDTAMVSPISKAFMPTIAHRSPLRTSSLFRFQGQQKRISSLSYFFILPSRLQIDIVFPFQQYHRDTTRPIAILPRKLL